MAIGTTRLAALKRTWRQEKEGEDSSEGRDEQGTVITTQAIMQLYTDRLHGASGSLNVEVIAAM